MSASDSTYDDRIHLTWKDRSDFEDGYEISRAEAATPLITEVLDTTRANVTLFDDFAAEPDLAYIYHVRTLSDLGGASTDSSDAGFRSIVLAPTGVVATDGTRENLVNIVWQSTSTTAVLFKIYRSDTFIKSVSKVDRSYQDYGGTAGQIYDYTVAAVTALEVEALGDTDAGSRDIKKSASPVVASDEAYEEKIVITWEDNSALEHGYLVSRRDPITEPLIGSYDTPGDARVWRSPETMPLLRMEASVFK